MAANINPERTPPTFPTAACVHEGPAATERPGLLDHHALEDDGTLYPGSRYETPPEGDPGHNPWRVYGAEKARLASLGLTCEEYDAAIRDLLDRLGQ